MSLMMRSSVTSCFADRLDRLAVADDRDRVGDLLDLVQLVADDDRRDALPLEVQDQVEQVIGVLVVERGGGLVEDEELHLLRERLRDLDELLLADADVHDLRRGVLAQADAGEELRRLEVRLVPVDQAAAALRSLLRKMFSAIDRYGLSASSWWMMTMPLASLSVRSRNSTVSFSKTMSPS